MPVLDSGAKALPLATALTECQLAELHRDCVNRINEYRAGSITFSNGRTDCLASNGTLRAYNHAVLEDQCHDEGALGDLVQFLTPGQGCAHYTPWACTNFGGSQGQNSCCLRSGTSYSVIQTALYDCLQQMWDEGENMPCDAPFNESTGHWQNMRSPNLIYASCGFAFDSAGDLFMVQNFASSYSGTAPTPGLKSPTSFSPGTTQSPFTSLMLLLFAFSLRFT